MSDLDKQALETFFTTWRTERASDRKESTAFELFSIEQVLKDYDLSDEEIASSHIAGNDDGGVDGFYFFINRLLIQDETEIPNPAISAHLVIIQAKKSPGFSETTVQKLQLFTADLLDYTKKPEDITYLGMQAREAIAKVRESYGQILASQHTFSVSFHYVTTSTEDPHPKTLKRVENLKTEFKQSISAAVVDFDFWGSARLLNSARTLPISKFTIGFHRQFSTHDNGAVALVKLKNFAQSLQTIRGSSEHRFSSRMFETTKGRKT